MKECTGCGESKPETEFYRKNKAGALRPECKKCHCLRTTTDYKKSRQVWDSRRRLKRYGLTLDQFEKLLVEHNSQCAICGCPYQVIDHNHETGIVRGLLCHRCNRALGMLKDNSELFEKASAYLKTYGGYRPMVRTPVCESGNAGFESP
jgi:hypothetical protein